VTSGELLTKQAIRKNNKKKPYIIKLLLNVVTAGIEALVSVNKFFYACVKVVCHLWSQPRFDTFHPLLHIVIPTNFGVGKPTLVARSEIGVVRRVVKQLSVEMLQQLSSTSTCNRARIVMEEHYNVCQHSTPIFRNILMHFSRNTLLLYCGPLYHDFQHQCSFPDPENSYDQLPGRQIFRLVWWMCVRPLLSLLFGFNVHRWNPGFTTCHSYDIMDNKFIVIFVL
jgi:hypothetical protein